MANIEVRGKRNYEWTNGKKPRGTGHWLFKIGKEEKSFYGSFTDAQAKARRYAAQYNKKQKAGDRVYHITVLP